MKVFQTIVGVDKDKQISLSGRKHTSDGEYWKADRETTRELMFQLTLCKINVPNLQGWFIQASKGSESINRETFEEYLNQELSETKNITEKK